MFETRLWLWSDELRFQRARLRTRNGITSHTELYLAMKITDVFVNKANKMCDSRTKRRYRKLAISTSTIFTVVLYIS